MTGDDERRAEIEAVARALAVDNGWCYSPHFYRGLAEVAIAALDRVRDARGDDEDSTSLVGDLERLIRRIQNLSLPHSFEALGERGQALHALSGERATLKRLESLTGQESKAARVGSVAVEDVLAFLRDDRIPTPPEWHRAADAVEAEFSRSSTVRPEQPPPDTLGGQPPAEPPEAS